MVSFANVKLPDGSVCKDEADDCSDYGKDYCNGVYKDWMRDHCSLFCGVCTQSRGMGS